MYSIYSKVGNTKVCLYDDSVADQSVKLIDPVLEVEENKAGSLTFTLPPTNIGYNKYTITTTMVDHINSDGTVVTKNIDQEVDLVGRMSSTITLYRDNDEIWEGRVLSEQKDWYNCREVVCEGELGYLNDTMQQPKRYHDVTLRQFLEVILNLHNSKVDDSKKFYVGTVTVTETSGLGSGNSATVSTTSTGYHDTEYKSTWDTLADLLTDYKGILRIRKVNGKRYLDWLADYPNVSNQTIDFGKNLLDFKCTWDMSSLCTVLLPTGGQVSNAGEDSIGEVMTIANSGGVPTSGQLLYLDEDNIVQINANEGLGGYKTATYNIDSPSDSYQNPVSIYISCRLHGGLVGFVAKSGAGGMGNQLSYITLTQDSGHAFKDLVDYKVTLPAGTRSFILCSFGDDIPICAKTNIPGSTTTITGTTLSPVVTADGQRLYLEDDRVYLDTNAGTGYKVYTYYLSGITKVWITCRLHGGFVAWDAEDAQGGVGAGNQLLVQTATQDSGYGFKDFVNYEVTLPSGTRELVVCSFGNDVPLKVMTDVTSETEETEGSEFDKYLTVEEYADDPGWHTKGSQYVINQEMVDKYGWIEKGLALEEVTDVNTLYSMAKAYLQNGLFDEMTIELSAVDMKMLGTESDYINLLDKVLCDSAPHGLHKLFPVTKLSIPLNKPADQKFTLGTSTTNSLTESSNDINADIIKKISIKNSETLQSAFDNAKNLIAMASNGHISTIYDEDGKPKEFVISDTEDPNDCTSCWVWNVNGLGHFNHYPITDSESATNLALTMDGAIVASSITTGILTGILIRGVNVVLGGMDSQPGSMLIKSSTVDQDYCVEHKNGGIYFGILQSESDPDTTHPSGSYSASEHGHIRGDIEFQTGGGILDHGLAIDSKVIALDCDELWVTTNSEYSGGGTDAIAGLDMTSGGSNQVWLPVGTDANNLSYVGVQIRHGIVTGIPSI